MRFRICRENGEVLALASKKLEAIDMGILFPDGEIIFLPKELEHLYMVGEIVPRNIMRSCDLESLARDLGEDYVR
ncbi:hypothetical protein G7B40_001730 [Aetokthonos hydrillicola Thurmond2011]|jgi:hypothetical protein|uniref:Uncharacterized protein n=1 Tax=Aetokthonos hydrillicola Thurmond2011 TaxID=2712845 RepID=A0AAP5I3Y4_9CYAN|nr:hypothetical protein [Aetokthonos hydrillicola]MBO3462957.1 hypothetical protein [Aetokthonos hydrillicola CCALA 1050]MBW4591253.1 hypothetical protein [Aetokthonos hydrillicola CCALA 1050]MDR9893307.1 hypothetical protein [Aetokthonos hydrillicola Thurmond2011]